VPLPGNARCVRKTKPFVFKNIVLPELFPVIGESIAFTTTGSKSGNSFQGETVMKQAAKPMKKGKKAGAVKSQARPVEAIKPLIRIV